MHPARGIVADLAIALGLAWLPFLTASLQQPRLRNRRAATRPTVAVLTAVC
jgi:hypothetical protein